MKRDPLRLSLRPLLAGLPLAALLLGGCQKSFEPKPTDDSPQVLDASAAQKEGKEKLVGHFTQTNLVANTAAYGAARIDATLINGWGIAFNPTGIPWVNSQGGHVSEVWNSEGVPVRPPVNIPLPNAPTGGNPTGIVFNGSNTDFLLPTGGAARFIFVGVDGVLSAWNGAQGNNAFRKAFFPGSAFTGLTLGLNNGAQLLYAANFSQRRIDVWNGSWSPVSLSFTDPNLPAGYSPYNIQNIGGLLYVAYAKVANNGRADAGVGKGIVNVFNTAGGLVKRFATGGLLNAPWGLTLAPHAFVDNDDENDDADDAHEDFILVGNFGDGRINAYRTDGKFKGQLRLSDKKPVVIPGLWAITFPPSTSTINPMRLYFAAGPNDERDGLFGYLLPRADDDDHDD